MMSILIIITFLFYTVIFEGFYFVIKIVAGVLLHFFVLLSFK